MSKRTRAVDPELLPHPRPCWCDECRRAYSREYMRDYKPVRIVICGACGGEFPTPCPSGKPPKYCSDDCRELGAGRHTKIGYCCECGAAFPKNGGNRKRCDAHFLGDNNRPGVSHHRPCSKVAVECRWCHREYSVSVGLEEKRITCSVDCRRQLTDHHGRYGYSDRAPLPTCVVCGDLTGKPPPPRREDYGLTSTRFRCSEHEVSDEATNARKNAKKRRRESVNAGETFTVHDLIERDGDWCHIGWCGQRVRFDVSPYHPRYGTIDHLVPISEGGEHTMANTKVACRECNCRRGAKELADVEPVQLRLVG